MIPCRIIKSITTGVDVVLNFGEHIQSKHFVIGINSNACTSPSMHLGAKSTGNSKSNTYSVLGKRPRSLSKKKETLPAETRFSMKSGGTEASSWDSLIAVSFML